MIAWVTAHWAVLLPVVVLVAGNLANGLSKYPARCSLFHAMLDVACFLTRKDSPGTLKLPGFLSDEPKG